MTNDRPLIAIVGPTASGKTSLGVRLASLVSGEILSADSRQVYRRMNIGTGKDLNEYTLPDGTTIPYHLIDIVEPGEVYDLYQWQKSFNKALLAIQERDNTPILVGGSGLYVETALGGRSLTEAPKNIALRNELSHLSHRDLLEVLRRFKGIPQTDTSSVRRTIRAIEIASYYERYTDKLPIAISQKNEMSIPHYLFTLSMEAPERWERIGKRLRSRLDEGMIEEVRALLNEGVSAEILIQYGLEYKYITYYLLGKLDLDTMISELEIAIRQFAKRQMTWFRGMKRRGFNPIFLDATLPQETILEQICSYLPR
ncbi:tRNA delta(2)-isopentenylpyrophosphate transferase [Porphyromonas gingivicanis]|uniref:tRNA dimethylallyltransferase n=1 Tax=Porphyromonas gingivicanis TaxID=266762 RepID=A0A0A2G455_9PORP|nr:tRNA (adenosine(37)-N6)-dimethylallyltransferase MiaA [Porphyromonas gingivicanis]KGN98011.1 tRNA delta(2)-isopentenylpyrophosphate transferase [Porphyromonas gingivicanis]